MGLFDGYNVSSSGMDAQRTRVNVVSANIANAQTTHTKDGGPYKKQNVVFEEILMQSQQKTQIQNNSTVMNKQGVDIPVSGVGVRTILESKDEAQMKYEPGHPDANKDGYVAYPNINPVVEMVDLIEAMRSYEANVSAFTAHKNIDTKTIEILRG